MILEVKTVECMTTKQAAKKWSISERRVAALCEKGRVEGAYLLGRVWAIPSNAPKPPDARIKSGKYIKS